MEIWVFLAKQFTQKPASQLHPGTLAVLVRYNQAQKCLQYDPIKASNKKLQNLKKNYSMEFSTDF